MSVSVFLLAVCSISLSAVAQILLKQSTTGLASFGTQGGAWLSLLQSLATNPPFIAGMLCYLISMAVWMAVLSKAEVSVAYPMTSLGYLLVMVLGYLYLGESVNLMRVVGVVIIGLGILVVAKSA